MNRLTLGFCCVVLISSGFYESVACGQEKKLLTSDVKSATSVPCELRDHDRVIFLGGTFIERMQNFGHLEALLTVGLPQKNVTFRNLGWSGDTVWGESRGVFGNATEGFKRLVKDVTETKPTVIVICYGANEANAGPANIPNFMTGLNRLLDALIVTKARFLLVSPPKREKMPAPLPDPRGYNEVLGQYAQALADVAKNRNIPYFDLYAKTAEVPEPPNLVKTVNGLHYSEFGDWELAPRFAAAFGITLGNTAPGEADTEQVALWRNLRSAIHEKNVLYFHRHRPQNETYLFLFRKHEQGNNAVEIPQFDPLIAEHEKRIAEMKKPSLDSYHSLKVHVAPLSAARR